MRGGARDRYDERREGRRRSRERTIERRGHKEE